MSIARDLKENSIVRVVRDLILIVVNSDEVVSVVKDFILIILTN